MTPGQHDAATIHLRWGQSIRGQAGPRDERASACRAERGFSLRRKNGVALAADTFHI
jgi:hypothetical protein